MAITSTRCDEYGNYTGFVNRPKNIYPVINKYMTINDTVYQTHKVVVHKFIMGDVEDPDLYAAQPLLEWQQSEMGKWVMEHSLETPMWHRHVEPITYGYKYAITAYLKGPDYTFWTLKWGQSSIDRGVL